MVTAGCEKWVRDRSVRIPAQEGPSVVCRGRREPRGVWGGASGTGETPGEPRLAAAALGDAPNTQGKEKG